MKASYPSTGQTSTLEAINLGSDEDPCTLKIAEDLASDERATLVRLLMDYQDVFAWS